LTRSKPEHTYSPASEIGALTAYRDAVHSDPKDNRHIPVTGQQGQVLIATWNIANLGVHKRRAADIKVIAEILSWFEIVAIQEVADNASDFYQVVEQLPDHFDYIFSDRAGNDERAAYIFDTRRVSLGPLAGELAIVDNDRKNIVVEGISRKFQGFNRNPYLVSFVVEAAILLLANCHLIYGPSGSNAEKKASMEKRQLEAYAVSRWCDLRRKDKHTITERILALGDFNLPKAAKGDPIFDALTDRGLRLPPHETRIPTNVSNTADFDQIAVTPGQLSRITQQGVFDFDGAIFANIYDHSASGYWRTCAKYYISDHRPLWIQYVL
jgi:endonuclease/exonuclease/phosphatase family metal-dependent hydrolase